MVFSLAGCTSIPRETVLMREVDATNISAYELRERLNRFALRFSGMVQSAADEIIAKCTDPEAKRIIFSGVYCSFWLLLSYGLR
jgi:hypothetical protein